MERKFKYAIALGFYTNTGVTNDKVKDVEHLFNNEYEIVLCYSVIFNIETKEIVDEFEKVIKPEKNPNITEAVTKVTGITEIDIENGTEFFLFIVEYQQWLSLNQIDPYDEANRNFVFVTFGDWDLRDILPKQCLLQELEIPLYFDEWINVQRLMYALTGIGGNIKQVTTKAKMTSPNKAGIEEGRAIIAILRYLLDQNVPLLITSMIDSEGNFIEKEIKISPLAPPSVPLNNSNSALLSLPVSKRALARGKYPPVFYCNIDLAIPTPPVHLLPSVHRKGKELLKD